MAIALDIALAHLASRKRQTLVSLTGVVLGQRRPHPSTTGRSEPIPER